MTFAFIRLTLVALAGLAAGALTALAVLPQALERLLPGANVRIMGEARIGGPFALTDLTGKTVTDADFRGRTMLVVFGSPSSPDATAPVLQVLSAALERLGPRAERLAPVLIIVDPEPNALDDIKRFVASFHPRLLGLTGTPQQIAQVLAAYRVPGIHKSQDPASPGRYMIDYPPPIYVMGPDGRYRGHLSFAAGADAIAANLAGVL